MNRCLAYARRLRGSATVSFFSLASAIECIEEMGFAAEYFISHFWTDNNSYDWNTELAIRFGLVLERVRPQVIVFDGTWPFQGFLAACKVYGKARLVWSNRGLFKAGTKTVPVDESLFDLILRPGELGEGVRESVLPGGGRKIVLPPVVLLDDEELLGREKARAALGLDPDARYALFSLGPGNLKNIGDIGHNLCRCLQAKGVTVVWACAPISVRDVALPTGVIPLSVYPLVRFFKAFDVFVGAAGYNTCCEVVQTQLPSLLVPNSLVVDDQAERARLVSENASVIVSTCETQKEVDDTVDSLLRLAAAPLKPRNALDMSGAAIAAAAIRALADN